MADNKPQPKPVDPKEANTQTAQDNQQKPKAVDPKADASPRLVRNNKGGQPRQYVRGDE